MTVTARWWHLEGPNDASEWTQSWVDAAGAESAGWTVTEFVPSTTTQGVVAALREVRNEIEVALSSEPPVMTRRTLRSLAQSIDRLGRQ